MMNSQELSRLHEEAERELMKIPGVLGVGFGNKEVGGVVTDEISFRVYVKEKKNPADLSPSEMVPKKYKEYPTDVIKIASCQVDHCQDTGGSSKVVGGISVSNLKEFLQVYQAQSNNRYALEFGTVACIATIDGESSRNKYAFVTNRHVLDKQGGQNGSTVYNPRLTITNDTPSIAFDSTNRPVNLNAVGKILNIGIVDNYNYSYPGEAAKDYFIDCASVKIDTCISSWCGTRCGKGFKNEIPGLNVNGGNNITGIKRVTAADVNKPVYKVGRTTGKTVGKIIDPLGMAMFPSNIGLPNPNQIAKNIIIVEVTAPNCNGDMFFTDSGDSGSAYIDEDRNIIGVHYAHNNTTNRKQSFAGHIHPIMHRLGVTPITASNASQAQSISEEVPSMIFSSEQNEIYFESIKSKAQQTEASQHLMKLVEEYRSEVVHKVNYSRPVTVTWHRHKGPTFLQHFMRSSRDPEYKIPREVDGISLNQLIKAMASILKEEGSYGLKNIIQDYENILHKSCQNIHRVEDLITQFNLFYKEEKKIHQ